jgi:hypothetical protein
MLHKAVTEAEGVQIKANLSGPPFGNNDNYHKGVEAVETLLDSEFGTLDLEEKGTTQI